MVAKKKQVLGQVASVGEAAFEKLAQNPATHKMLEGVMQGKEWVDRVVRGFESIEQRLVAIEKRLDALEKGSGGSTRKTTTAKRSASSSTKRSTTSSKSSS
jgi:hypothetical protein